MQYASARSTVQAYFAARSSRDSPSWGTGGVGEAVPERASAAVCFCCCGSEAARVVSLDLVTDAAALAEGCGDAEDVAAGTLLGTAAAVVGAGEDAGDAVTDRDWWAAESLAARSSAVHAPAMTCRGDPCGAMMYVVGNTKTGSAHTRQRRESERSRRETSNTGQRKASTIVSIGELEMQLINAADPACAQSQNAASRPYICWRTSARPGCRRRA